jgi:hypothetical protein
LKLRDWFRNRILVLSHDAVTPFVTALPYQRRALGVTHVNCRKLTPVSESGPGGRAQDIVRQSGETRPPDGARSVDRRPIAIAQFFPSDIFQCVGYKPQNP